MIPLLTREAVRALDAEAVARLALPSLLLMENAGRGAFEVLRARFGGDLGRVAILGGVGQNGGDAWVVARQLIVAGYRPRCLLVGERAKVKGDAALNLHALERMGWTVPCLSDAAAAGIADSPLDAVLDHATLIVDGLLGTGIDRPVGGLYAAVIERINACPVPRIALDIPSGVDANSGAVLGAAVAATHTVTFASHKRGLHQHPGARLAGDLSLASIGVPAPDQADCWQLEAADVARWLPRRAPDAHKGSGGHVLVVAGAPGRTGAALLSGLAALRGGAGLVTLCPRAGARAALDAKVIELMTAELPAEPSAAVPAVLELITEKHAAVVGPGLGLDHQGRELARRLALELPKPAVLDADALTALGTELSALRHSAAPRVLTPHPAEAGRLLGISTERVQADRYAAAAKLAADSGQVAVLKGARTLIASPEGQLHVCPLDAPALAVAGTGDVLSGAIAALLPRLSPFEAASAAVYLHACAGALAAASDRGLFAREVAAALPRALEACRNA